MNIRYRNLAAALAGFGLIMVMPLALAQTYQGNSAGQQQPTAQAASPRPHTWKEIDADGDSAITKTEAKVDAGLSNVFDEADADGDGRLTTAEYTAYIQKRSDAAATQDQGGTDKLH